MLPSHVLAFGGIILQIVKCEWLPNLQPDGFPIPHTHRLFRALLVEFPVKELVLIGLLLSKERWEH